MKRFINDDAKLKKGGRNAIKTTDEELKKIIIKKAISTGKAINSLSLALNEIFFDSAIRKDLKVVVGTDNIWFESEPHFGTDNLVGFHTFENGFNFLGCIICGDDECPCGVFTVLYSDGKKLRCYTPSYGNTFNLDTKTAFGAEDDTKIPNFNFHKLMLKYKKLGYFSEGEFEIEDFEDFEEMDEDDIFEIISDLYVRKYDMEEVTDAKINWDAIKKDIISRIEIVS